MKSYVLITGASSGIGLELAKSYASRGENLILIARRENLLSKLKTDLELECKVNVITIPLDITEDEAVEKIISVIKLNRITVSTLINNAGLGGHGFFHERSKKSNLNMIDLNIKALVNLTYEILPGMLENKNGNILNIASTAGMLPGPLQSVYYATKAFVISFSQALSEEVKEFGVTVSTFCPGSTKTEFHIVGDLGRTELFRSKMVLPEIVAGQAIKALEKKRIVASSNKTQMFLLRYIVPFMPRRIMLKLSRSYLETI